MNRLEKVADLEALRKELKQEMWDVEIRVAMATCSVAVGARKVFDVFERLVSKEERRVRVVATGCMGLCYAEPTVEVLVEGRSPVMFSRVDSAKAEEIYRRYICLGEAVDGTIEVRRESL